VAAMSASPRTKLEVARRTKVLSQPKAEDNAQTPAPSREKKDLIALLRSLTWRAEAQNDNLLGNLVPIIDLDSLFAHNTQIIYGRNETGKTHLFQAFCEYAMTNFEEKRTLAVYVDCSKLHLGPALPSISIDNLLLAFYRGFIWSVVDSLHTFADATITPSFLERVLHVTDSNARLRSIETSIQTLDGILRKERVEELVSEYTRKISETTEGKTAITGGFGLNAKLSSSKSEAAIEGKASYSSSEIEDEKQKLELVYKGLAVIKYADIRVQIETILEQVGANSLILLIDEWSSITPSLQPLLAETLQKTLSPSSQIFHEIGGHKIFHSD